MAKKKELYQFEGVLMFADYPTVDGKIYPSNVVMRVMERLNTQPNIIIQDMNRTERTLKNIPLAEPWIEKVMGDVISARMDGTKLVFTAVTRQNRYGKMLQGIVSNDVGNFEYVPVGYGTVNEANIVNLDYRLNYIALEAK